MLLSAVFTNINHGLWIGEVVLKYGDVRSITEQRPISALKRHILSEGHRDAPGTGCALGALLGDMSRASRSAKAVYTARLKRSLAYSTGLVPPSGTSDRRARAILMISAMLGAINLSRAVSDPNLSREILQQTRDQLISLNKPATPH